MARLESELTTSFESGMVDGAAPTAMPKSSALAIINGRIEPDGTVRRRPGSKRAHASVLLAGIGYGGAFFTTAAGVDLIVAIFGTKAFDSDDLGVTWTEIASSLREDYYTFAVMRVGATTYLYAANGDTTIKSYDGTTWTTVTNAPSGVKFIAPFNGRLYATGHSGVLVQASKIGTPTTWASPDGLTVQVAAVPTGLFQIGPHLLVWDRDSTSYIDGFGEQTIIVAAGSTGLSRSVGCVAFRTIVGVGDNGVCWLSKRGVEYYATGSGIQLLSSTVPTFMASIDWEDLYSNPGRASAVYDAIEQNLHIALSTNGIRNNRVLVLNIRQSSAFQRPGPRSAATVDRLLSPTSNLLFTVDDDGYLTAGATGFEAESDADGYLRLAALSTGGEAVGEDADGYLESDTNDTLPATLFIAPTIDRPTVVYSLGYDGFVRVHRGVDADDMLSDETGGTDVEMVVVSRPFLLRAARQRKRVRIIHVAAITDSAATLTVLVHHHGATSSSEKTVTIEAGADSHADRKRALVNLISDDPHVEVRTTDDVKLSLVGISAERLREAA